MLRIHYDYSKSAVESKFYILFHNKIIILKYYNRKKYYI